MLMKGMENETKSFLEVHHLWERKALWMESDVTRYDTQLNSWLRV